MAFPAVSGALVGNESGVLSTIGSHSFQHNSPYSGGNEYNSAPRR